MTFCNDIDLLHWEPNICRDAAFASQTLISGTGNLAGTGFTIASGSLVTSHVAQEQVVVLSGAHSGSYPIVSVDGATQLTLSVLYDGLFPAAGSPAASPVSTVNGLAYAIRTFWPQRRVVSELIVQAAGLDPGDPQSSDRIINAENLKRACTLGTLHMIYSALAAAAAEPGGLLVRVDLYERLYRRAIREARVELDLNGDGEGDTMRSLNVLQLQRA
jgi:hypothetical protein